MLVIAADEFITEYILLNENVLFAFAVAVGIAIEHVLNVPFTLIAKQLDVFNTVINVLSYVS